MFAPVCRPAARERSGTARKAGLTSDYSTLHPHARAAAPPSGRSFFWHTVHSWQLSVRGRGCDPAGLAKCWPFLSIAMIRSSPRKYVSGKPTEGPDNGRTEEPGQVRRQKMKKGAGASPLFVIDAPKPVTESRIGSGHPGKPILYVAE